MGFQQGLSGLNAASKSLDVIGNNISNASTVGFKQAEVQFADVYANSLNGSGGGQVGIGTKVAAIAQQFTQGNVTNTNNPLDIAINGNGFFRMNTNGSVSYTRNGQFQLDKTGNIVNAQGAQLTGYVANANGVLSTGSPAPININTADISPAQTTVANAIVNLDSRQTNPGGASPIAFSPTDPTSYNNATSVSVFDSLGNSHELQTFFAKDPAALTWNVYATSDGVPIGYLPPAAPIPLGKLTFDNLGKMVAATPAFSANDPRALKVAVPVTTGAVTPISTPIDIKLDFTGSTQFGSNFGVSTLKQDGFASGKLSSFTTAKDGTIVGSYTNGKTAVLGQVVLASFTNPNGLQSVGDNQWNETSTSGQALIGAPGSSGQGTLTSSAVEDSNTDLTAELVNMITAQRVYQANAQTIKTEDQIQQTLVNLR